MYLQISLDINWTRFIKLPPSVKPVIHLAAPSFFSLFKFLVSMYVVNISCLVLWAIWNSINYFLWWFWRGKFKFNVLLSWDFYLTFRHFCLACIFLHRVGNKITNLWKQSSNYFAYRNSLRYYLYIFKKYIIHTPVNNNTKVYFLQSIFNFGDAIPNQRNDQQ